MTLHKTDEKCPKCHLNKSQLSCSHPHIRNFITEGEAYKKMTTCIYTRKHVTLASCLLQHRSRCRDVLLYLVRQRREVELKKKHHSPKSANQAMISATIVWQGFILRVRTHHRAHLACRVSVKTDSGRVVATPLCRCRWLRTARD